MRAPAATAVAIATGAIVLLGYWLPLPILQNARTTLLGWAVVVGGVAMLVGIANLVSFHWRKMTDKSKKDFFSAILLLSFIVTLTAGLWFGPADRTYQKAVLAIQVPVEASLLGMMAITLAAASLRLLKRRKDMMSILFVFSVVVFLLLGSGILAGVENIPGFQLIIAGLNRLPVAGARGILLGIALGSLTADLRILFGADRPYSG